jgi:hypothetical protein
VEVTFQAVLSHVSGRHTCGGGCDITRQTDNPETDAKPYPGPPLRPHSVWPPPRPQHNAATLNPNPRLLQHSTNAKFASGLQPAAASDSCHPAASDPNRQPEGRETFPSTPVLHRRPADPSSLCPLLSAVTTAFLHYTAVSRRNRQQSSTRQLPLPSTSLLRLAIDCYRLPTTPCGRVAAAPCHGRTHYHSGSCRQRRGGYPEACR